jgi:hypothetical protein
MDIGEIMLLFEGGEKEGAGKRTDHRGVFVSVVCSEMSSCDFLHLS